jgi:hypothetical protein
MTDSATPAQTSHWPRSREVVPRKVSSGPNTAARMRVTTETPVAMLKRLSEKVSRLTRYPGRRDRMRRRICSHPSAAVDLDARRRAHIRLHRGGWRAAGGPCLPRGKRRLPYRVPQRVPGSGGTFCCRPPLPCYFCSLLGIVHPRAQMLVDLLPYATFGWLGLGIIAPRCSGPGARRRSSPSARSSSRPGNSHGRAAAWAGSPPGSPPEGVGTPQTRR